MRVKVAGMQPHEKAHNIATCCQLALLLEVSAYPKPGLVHRTGEFRETSFEHFLSSASSLYWPFFEAAMIGIRGKGSVGYLVKLAVRRMLSWQHGGNTHLGAILLLIPIAVAAGMSDDFPVKPGRLRKELRSVLKMMGPKDTEEIFQSIAYVTPGGLGRVPYLDVKERKTYEEIRRKKITPLMALEHYVDRDIVAHEWVTGYSLTFDLGYKELKRQIKKTKNFNEAVVNAFLKMLAQKPDTLVMRRAGIQIARLASAMATKAIKLGGISSTKGRKEVEKMDEEFRKSRLMRPGATADLLCSSLAILLIEGFRP
ncbi:MAG: triphosphoribosyl-dephospho-CoA synthase [Nitrososphaerota archaeon]|nr:triphosphoribosyl-dephospho-CoA synthase [Aigarchaeota archaeon]MDW8076754.1 triphosphoribosyl-dephospho-CoA synthase [Nitrososphaerota archaeon]